MSLVHVALARYTATPEFSEAIQRQASELVTSELGQCDDEWRGAVLSLRETVAALERACDAVLSRAHPVPSGAVALHVEGILETAADEAARAAEHAQVETRVQLGRLQTLAERLEADLGVARDELTQAREGLSAERTARTRVEAESADARTRYEQAIGERDAELRRQAAKLDAQRQECATLSQQLAAVRSGNGSLLTMLQTMHGQIGRVMTSVLQAAPDAAGDGISTDVWPGAAHTEAAAPEQPPLGPIGGPAAEAAPAGGAGHREVQPPVAPIAEPSDSALSAYVASLLDTAETKYREDLESGLLPLDVVERLTSNLRHARDLFVDRAGCLQNGQASLFETVLMRLVDTRGGTAFGRHLGIAAYQLFSPRPS